MQLTLEQADAFLAGEAIEGVRFQLNEEVEIVEGAHRGTFGSVIAIESLGADPILVVELSTGLDLKVAQSCLSSARA